MTPPAPYTLFWGVNLLLVRELRFFPSISCTTPPASSVVEVERLDSCGFASLLQVVKLLVHWLCDVSCSLIRGWGFVSGLFFFVFFRRIQRCYCTWKGVFRCCVGGQGGAFGEGRGGRRQLPAPQREVKFSVYLHISKASAKD